MYKKGQKLYHEQRKLVGVFTGEVEEGSIDKLLEVKVTTVYEQDIIHRWYMHKVKPLDVEDNEAGLFSLQEGDAFA